MRLPDIFQQGQACGRLTDGCVRELRQVDESLTPRVLDLIEAIQHEEPGSINKTARMIDRDVKNVQVELDRLAQIGLINFEEKGQRKRPVVWFDEFVIQLAFEDEADGATTLAP